MSMKSRWECVVVILIALAMLLMTGCDLLGACEGTSPGEYYCYDDLTSGECADYQMENRFGADWRFHEGYYCDEL